MNEYFGYGPADVDIAVEWELKHNIAIIRPTRSLEDLLELTDRYQAMDCKYRDISDKACYEIFGMQTREHFELIKKALENNGIPELFNTEIMPKMVFYKRHLNMIFENNEPSIFIFKTIMRIRKNCKGCYEDAVFSNIVSSIVTKYKSTYTEPMNLSSNDYPILKPDRMEELGVFQDDPTKNYFGVEGDDSVLSKKDRKDWFDKYKLAWDACCGAPKDRTKWVSCLRSMFNNINSLDESAQKARKQSILEFGWNPMIPFTPENRKYSDAIYKNHKYKFMTSSNLVDMRGINTSDGDSLSNHNCVLLMFIYPDESLRLNPGEKPLIEFLGYSFDGLTVYSPCIDGIAKIRISQYSSNKDHCIASFGIFLPKESYIFMKEQLKQMTISPYEYKDCAKKFNILQDELRKMINTGEISIPKMASMYRQSLHTIFGIDLDKELTNHVFFLSCKKAEDYQPDSFCFDGTSINESVSMSVFNKDKISLNEIMNLDISNSCNDRVIIEAYNTFIAPIQNGIMIPKFIEENRFEFVDSSNIINEAAPGSKPFFIILFKGKMPWSYAIAAATGSQYSHAAVAFDPNLNTMYSYAAGEDKRGLSTSGFIKESITKYKKSEVDIGVFCIFCAEEVINKMHKYIDNFNRHKDKTSYSFEGLVRFLLHAPKDYDYKLFCSQFCDKLLKAAGIDLTGITSALVSPGTFDKLTVTDDRIYAIYTGSAVNYKPYKTKSQIVKMLRNPKTYSFGEMCDISYLEN